MPLFDTRTQAQVVADDIIARLETDFRARVALNGYLLNQITADVLIALAKKGAAVVDYFKANADFCNTRQPGAINTRKIDDVTKNPDGSVTEAAVVVVTTPPIVADPLNP